MELWDIRANRQFVAKGRLAVKCLIVLLEAFAYIARMYANDRIITSRVVSLSVKQLAAKRALLEKCLAAIQFVAHNIREKLPTAAAAAERSAPQDSL